MRGSDEGLIGERGKKEKIIKGVGENERDTQHVYINTHTHTTHTKDSQWSSLNETFA